MYCMRKQSSMTIPGLPSLLHCQPTLRAPPSTHVIHCFNQQLSIPSSSKRNILVHRPGKKGNPIPACLKVAYPVRLHVEFQRTPLHTKDPRGSHSPQLNIQLCNLQWIVKWKCQFPHIRKSSLRIPIFVLAKGKIQKTTCRM